MMANLPSSPEKLDVSYYLFTAKNMLHPFLVRYNDSVSVLESSKFNPNDPIVFVIHGWITEFKHDHWTGVSTLAIDCSFLAASPSWMCKAKPVSRRNC